MRYFFILGRNPTLSSAELVAVIKKTDPDFIILEASGDVLLIETKNKLEIKEMIKILGGTIKAGVVMEETGRLEKENIFKILEESIKKAESGKIFFGFSLYNLENRDRKNFSETKKQTSSLAMEAKKFLKEKNFSSRWVTSKEDNLSSVIVAKNKLLEENGAEIAILVKNDQVFLGKTLAVQGFEELGFRDFGRPKRNMQVGLLPPKLAQIMINLSEVKDDGVILDPFCGFGTVLGEAMIAGYTNLIGSDINEEILAGAKENLDWLEKNYQLPTINYQLIKSDVRHIFGKVEEGSVGAIVTEPYLGHLLHGNEPKENILEIVKELSMLYLDAFREFKKVLKPNSKIVILFPIFVFQNEEIFLPIMEEIKKVGFEAVNLLSKELENKDFVKITLRQSIIYSRPGQKVLREVVVFKAI